MCEELKLSPWLNGLVKYEKDNEMDVIAKNNHMGSSYAKAMGSSLRFLKGWVLDFSGNKILDDGAIDLIMSMRACIYELNLSNNRLGDNSIRALLKWMDDP